MTIYGPRLSRAGGAAMIKTEKKKEKTAALSFERQKNGQALGPWAASQSSRAKPSQPAACIEAACLHVKPRLFGPRLSRTALIATEKRKEKTAALSFERQNR